jgi:hypothetical protein
MMAFEDMFGRCGGESVTKRSGASTEGSTLQRPPPLIRILRPPSRVLSSSSVSAPVAAAKMAAMGLPYYFFEVIEGGHGSGANIAQQARTTALEYTYFARQLMDRDRRFVP